MIAFVQPFGLQSPGGGPRILRSLLKEAPASYFSVCTSAKAPETSPNCETHLPVRPYLGRIEHTRFRRYLKPGYMTLALGSRFKRKLRRVLTEHGAAAVHAIPHGMDFWYAFEVADELGLPYYLNVHDEMTYNLPHAAYLDQAMENLGVTWRRAAGRIVISEAMGKEYCRRYGDRSYEIITDGLKEIADGPRDRAENALRVYLMGSIHMSYQANFDVLFEALSRLQASNRFDTVTLTTRPGFPFSTKERDVPVDVRPWGTQDDINRDLKQADLLYLPLPFGAEYESFVRYSLSTKLVTYLGTGLPILYHGPEHAAAGRLLDRHGAAISANTVEAEHLAKHIANGLADRDTYVQNALRLGRSQFMLSDQRTRFWSLLQSTTSPTPAKS